MNQGTTLDSLEIGDLEVEVLVLLSNFLEGFEFPSVDFPKITETSGGTEKTVVWIWIDLFNEESSVEFLHLDTVECGDTVDNWVLGSLESFFHIFLEQTGDELFNGFLAKQFFDILLVGLELVVSEFQQFGLLGSEVLALLEIRVDLAEVFLE